MYFDVDQCSTTLSYNQWQHRCHCPFQLKMLTPLTSLISFLVQGFQRYLTLEDDCPIILRSGGGVLIIVDKNFFFEINFQIFSRISKTNKWPQVTCSNNWISLDAFSSKKIDVYLKTLSHTSINSSQFSRNSIPDLDKEEKTFWSSCQDFYLILITNPVTKEPSIIHLA